ncbi:hypothetical protein K2Z84_23420 [Candidatus Binatia bacterium]|nr:hypothetical protein [Candidatus Binatia bacterium]
MPSAPPDKSDAAFRALLEGFEVIRYPQWAPALAWRSFARLLPCLLEEADPYDPCVANLLRVSLGYPVVLEVAFRNERDAPPSQTRMVAADLQTRQLLRDADRWSRRGSWTAEARPAIESALLMMQRAGGASSQLASRVVASLYRVRRAARYREAWVAALGRDFDTLEPFSKEAIGDLRRHLERPLWQATEPPIEAALVATSKALGRSTAGFLWLTLATHHTRRLEWVQVLNVLHDAPEEDLAPELIEGIERLIDAPQRLATLLAGIAFTDRSRLDLAAAPSVAGLRDCLGGGRSEVATRSAPAELLARERSLDKEARFSPNAAWLSWVLTVNGPAIASIQNELRSWLPQGRRDRDTSGAALGAEPNSSEGTPSSPKGSATASPAAKPRATAKKKAPVKRKPASTTKRK